MYQNRRGHTTPICLYSPISTADRVAIHTGRQETFQRFQLHTQACKISAISRDRFFGPYRGQTLYVTKKASCRHLIWQHTNQSNPGISSTSAAGASCRSRTAANRHSLIRKQSALPVKLAPQSKRSICRQYLVVVDCFAARSFCSNHPGTRLFFSLATRILPRQQVGSTAKPAQLKSSCESKGTASKDRTSKHSPALDLNHACSR